MWTLHVLRQRDDVEVTGLVTTVNERFDWVAMHAVRSELLEDDPKVLPRELAGHELDSSFLAELPPGVDPCGERGEFHTFAWAGPCFSESVLCTVGEIVERDGFVFADLLRRVDVRR